METTNYIAGVAKNIIRALPYGSEPQKFKIFLVGGILSFMSSKSGNSPEFWAEQMKPADYCRSTTVLGAGTARSAQLGGGCGSESSESGDCERAS